DATLASLGHSAGTFTGGPFSPAITEYTINVGNGITSMPVTPVTTETHATVTVNGQPVASGTASNAIAINFPTTAISITVTAADRTTIITYTVTINKAPETNANLASLHPANGALSPSFLQGTTSYTDAVANSVTATKVTPVTADATAT